MERLRYMDRLKFLLIINIKVDAISHLQTTTFECQIRDLL